MQAGVDKHTVARIWHFLRDGHFIDTSTRELDLRIAVVNHHAHTAAVWRLRISMLLAGRFRGQSTTYTAPMHVGPSREQEGQVYSRTMQLLLLALTLLHTLSVTGFLYGHRRISPETDGLSSSTRKATKDGQHSLWFRLLCLLGLAGLSISVLLDWYMGTASSRLVQEFDTSNMQIPADEYLPVMMYNNLWSPARMLLPGKAAVHVSSEGEGLCKLVSDGSSADLQVDTVLDDSSSPLWDMPEDTQSFDNLSLMMVRSISPVQLFIRDYIGL